MEHLFFNFAEENGDVAVAVFGLLGVDPRFGESKNVFNDSYCEATLFGMKLRFEENCYDYEDQFRYMLSVKRDVVLDATVRADDITRVARIVQHLLADNLGITVAIEVGARLEEYSPN